MVAAAAADARGQEISQPPAVKLVPQDAGVVEIVIGDQPIAVYHATDGKIPRPFFSDLRTRGGQLVSRRHPPDPARDLADHPEFHPGLWMAFGDISGRDDWRNKAPVELVAGSLKTTAAGDRGMIRAAYQRQIDGDPAPAICTEDFRAVIRPHRDGWLIAWDSTFSAPRAVVFGDQEEMGLGVRVATPMRSERQPRGDIAAGNGRILDAEGRIDGAEVWGQAARWCDFSGELDGQPCGVAIFCHPENFRASWFHARDYGLLVANPFGRRAFKQGEPSEVRVAPGRPLRLQYGVWVHGDLEDDAQDLERAYREYVALTDDVTARGDGPTQ